MGLIKAAFNALGGTLKDQYKEFIYCEALPMNVLVRKGQNKLGAGSTNKGNDNIISDGSRVAVADGQCLIIVENGKIVDFSAETGEYIYKTGTTPSMLTGGLEGMKKSFSTLVSRVQAGGGTEHDQRVYYVNTKELMGNKVGAGDIPFRDSEFNFTMKLKCFGEYSYKITDPLLFYVNVCGNIAYEFTKDTIESQFKAEVQASLQPALGRIALKRIPYDQLTLFTRDIAKELNIELTEEWVDRRGISVVSFALASVTPDAESAAKINKFQESRIYSDSGFAAGRLVDAQANAMESAGKNENGAMMGFMGMGMAQASGGISANQLFQQSQQQQKPTQQQEPTEKQPIQQTQEEPLNNKAEWTCKCGTVNTGKFCNDCGEKAPEIKATGTWKCSCGAETTGKFCQECGQKKPLDMHCETCGFDGNVPFKFCPECGGQNKI